MMISNASQGNFIRLDIINQIRISYPKTFYKEK